MTHITFPKPPRRERKPWRPINRSTKPIPRRKAPNKLRQSAHAKADRDADAQWRLEIKKSASWRCQALGEFYEFGGMDIKHSICFTEVDAAHGFPKGAYPSVRHDHRNGWAICRKMHDYYTRHPKEWTEFMKRKLGEAEYESLRQKAT